MLSFILYLYVNLVLHSQTHPTASEWKGLDELCRSSHPVVWLDFQSNYLSLVGVWQYKQFVEVNAAIKSAKTCEIFDSLILFAVRVLNISHLNTVSTA